MASNPRFRFNHMELTFPIGDLTADLKADIKTFYGDVFGWDIRETPGIMEASMGQTPLYVGVDEGQFLVLAESKDPMNRPAYDHLGLFVDNRQEVDEVYEKICIWQEKDERVEIKTYEDLKTPNMTVHAFYFRYLLPIHFDVQCHEWDEGKGPQKEWKLVENAG